MNRTADKIYSKMINHSAATQESDPTRVTTHRTVLITKLIAAVHHVLCTQLFNSKWRFPICTMTEEGCSKRDYLKNSWHTYNTTYQNN